MIGLRSHGKVVSRLIYSTDFSLFYLFISLFIVASAELHFMRFIN